MKIKLMVLFCCLLGTLCAQAVEHRFLCVDNGANRLIYVDQFREGCDWSKELPVGARDLQLIGDAVVLVSHGNGAGEYNLKDGKLLKVVSNAFKNITSARRLESEETMLVSQAGDVYLLDRAGALLRSFKIKHDNLDLRLARLNVAGHLLVLQTKAPRALLEVDLEGNVVQSIRVEGKGYRAEELKSGNTLISVGDSVEVIEIDSAGKTVRVFGGKEQHPTLGLDFFSGFHVLLNGNVIVANWLGHGKQGTAAHLFEFDADNNVVWQWGDHQVARQVTNVLVIE